MNHHSERRMLLISQNMELIRATITPDNANEDDEYGWSYMHLACSKNTPDNGAVITHLLDCGVCINDIDIHNGWTPLHCAVYDNQINCVRVLLARGADVTYTCLYGRTPLYHAHDKKCAYLLLDYKIDQLSMVKNDVIFHAAGTSFVAGRERARSASIILMGALKRKRMNRDLVPLIAQWVWATRGVDTK
jgi:ankyrin repeat protein